MLCVRVGLQMSRVNDVITDHFMEMQKKEGSQVLSLAELFICLYLLRGSAIRKFNVETYLSRYIRDTFIMRAVVLF